MDESIGIIVSCASNGRIEFIEGAVIVRPCFIAHQAECYRWQFDI